VSEDGVDELEAKWISYKEEYAQENDSVICLLWLLKENGLSVSDANLGHVNEDLCRAIMIYESESQGVGDVYDESMTEHKAETDYEHKVDCVAKEEAGDDTVEEAEYDAKEEVGDGYKAEAGCGHKAEYRYGDCTAGCLQAPVSCMSIVNNMDVSALEGWKDNTWPLTVSIFQKSEEYLEMDMKKEFMVEEIVVEVSERTVVNMNVDVSYVGKRKVVEEGDKVNIDVRIDKIDVSIGDEACYALNAGLLNSDDVIDEVIEVIVETQVDVEVVRALQSVDESNNYKSVRYPAR